MLQRLLTRRTFMRAAAGTLLAGAASLLGGCTSSAGTSDQAAAPATLQSTFFAFDTVCSVGGSVTRGMLDAAVAQCERYEQLFSRTIPTSDVARVNAAAGAPVEVDPATAELVAAALRYRAASDGAFDITIGAVSELWDFREGVVPPPAAIAAALPHVGAEVVVDQAASTVTLPDPQARIDLGGIAKGYVADAVIGALAAAGATSASVNLGGNVAVLGAKPSGAAWSVGVRTPFVRSADADATDASALIATIEVVDGSVVTSGLFERSFEADGRRYWHILDPRSGYPVETGVAGATVCAARSIDGDGYTKPLFFLDAEGRAAFFAAHPDLQVLVVLADGTIETSPGSAFDTPG